MLIDPAGGLSIRPGPAWRAQVRGGSGPRGTKASRGGQGEILQSLFAGLSSMYFKGCPLSASKTSMGEEVMRLPSFDSLTCDSHFGKKARTGVLARSRNVSHVSICAVWAMTGLTAGRFFAAAIGSDI